MNAPETGAQGALDLGGGDLYGKARRVESAVRQACESADLDDVDKGAAAVACELARAVDVASGRQDPYGVATAARELREQLSRLNLDPASRKDTGNAGAGNWLDVLGPTVPEPALRDTP